MTFHERLEDVNLGLTYAAQTFTILFDGVANAECYLAVFQPPLTTVQSSRALDAGSTITNIDIPTDVSLQFAQWDYCGQKTNSYIEILSTAQVPYLTISDSAADSYMVIVTDPGTNHETGLVEFDITSTHVDFPALTVTIRFELTFTCPNQALIITDSAVPVVSPVTYDLQTGGP